MEAGACSATTHYVVQGSAGFWRKLCEGRYGRLQAGLQYSYTERHAFSGLRGLAPAASDNIVFTAPRYYPFQ